jgi:hypothetical protein
MNICPVCGKQTTETYRDTLDGHTLLESTDECLDCNFYSYAYAYGNSQETIGFVAVENFHTGGKGEFDEKRQVRKLAIEEAVRLYRDVRRHDFGKNPQADPNIAGPFADWLDENGYPLHALAARDTVRSAPMAAERNPGDLD